MLLRVSKRGDGAKRRGRYEYDDVKPEHLLQSGDSTRLALPRRPRSSHVGHSAYAFAG